MLLKYIKDNWQFDAKRRILWLPVLFGTGIGIYFALPQEPSPFILFPFIVVLGLSAIFFRHSKAISKFILCLFFIISGFAVTQIKARLLYVPWPDLPSDTFYFQGKISDIDTNYQGRRRFILSNLQDFDGKVYQGRYRITQRSKKGEAKIGDCVEMIGKISPLSTEVVVGGYQFDRKSYFAGLRGSGFAQSRWFKIPCADGVESGGGFAGFVYDLRQKIVKRISSVLPPDEAAVTAAIIAGERGLISQKLNEQYRNSGLAHFLSISGLHMSMLAGLMFFLIRFLLAMFPPLAMKFDTKKISAVFAILISLVYLFISGMAVPAQRAFIMTFVVLLGVLVDRRAISMHTICLAAFIVLFLSPEVLVSASFQMSFAAVLGLIAFYEKTERQIRKFINVEDMSKWLRIVLLYIIGVVVSDFIASVMTLPFAIYHFNMVSIYTTIGNFLAGPIIGLIIMPFVLLSLLLMPFGMDWLFLKIVGYGIGLVNSITSWVSSFPYSDWQVPSMSHLGLLLIVFGGLWLMLWQASWRKLGWIGIILGCLNIFMQEVPDILVGGDLRAIAFKNKAGELELVSSRGARFIKNVWSNKYKFSKEKTKLKFHPEVKVKGDAITIYDQTYNVGENLGMSIYLHANQIRDILTIRKDIGERLWNKD